MSVSALAQSMTFAQGVGQSAGQQTPAPAGQQTGGPPAQMPQTTPPPKTPTVPPTAKPEQALESLPYTPSLDVNAMDKAADPCVDFYQYSCGGWMKANPIPADEDGWDVYSKLANENRQFLWGILENASKPSVSRTPVQQKIGDYFAACMDESAVEKAGMGPIEPTLKRIASMKSAREIPGFLAEQHLRSRSYYGGGSTLFFFTSDQDFNNSQNVIAFAYAGGLGLPDRDYYFKTDAKSQEIRQKYVSHMQRMFELMGDAPQIAAKEAQTVMDIETAMAKSKLTRVEMRDPYKLNHLMTRAQVQAMTPGFDWNAYLIAAGTADVQQMNVTEPEFFKAVDQLLKSRSLDDWKAYLRWHVAAGRAPYLSKKFADENFDFYSKTLRGVAEQQPRWKRCVQWVDRDLGEALGQEFVRRTFTPETKQRAMQMTELIEKAMENDINSLPWMGPETKKQALEKLHSIRNKIGYPEKWRDYSSVDVKRADFFGNVERAMMFESRRQLNKIGKPLDRGEWGMTPPTVNAYYNPQMNDINFPAGVLQPPLYDPKLDDAPNYGNTGATIGHELTHGFDDEGRQFDAQGNLKDWWTKQDATEFNQRVQCVKDQYKQYVVVDDIHINSDLTAGEDVADLGGTLLAYVAWKEATKGQELKPVEGLTPDQRFCIGMAQWACSNERPENMRVRALTDPHSPGKYRINGVVSNLPEFHKAFNCKAGQPMVRENACRVW
jgi:endothelin-converting enzyme/putative endopeptidase